MGSEANIERTGDYRTVVTPQPPAAESGHPQSECDVFGVQQPGTAALLGEDVAVEHSELGPTGRPMREVPEPAPLVSHGPAKIIAMCNQKGGVGKTTSTINLGASLAECGRRVLLVDLDPQGALSAGLGVAHHDLELTVHNLLVEPRVSIDEVLMRTRVEGLDLLPSNIDLSAAEIQLVTEVGREQTLGRVLDPVLDRYDYVLIDCQPSLGLLTINALACADSVIIPMECEYFSLRGLALLNDTVEKVHDRLNPRLELAGIVVTMFDSRTLHAREVMERVVEVFGDVVYDTVINRTVRFPETSVAGEPITTWAPKSTGAEAYRALAREVIHRSGR
ncbi:ParA family protein [Rhodococcus sp. WMMA185]|uniref:ParA family protein n=1 Tax=Rhodococcus sp. WMMA185 TaxID=679318 RepID=UPI000878247D|nr:ParA family protein [Rhodococcus sp. WMMA185]